jgi:autotransporter-associated beta strand protein
VSGGATFGGTATLSQANTYTGATTINSGTLKAAVSNAMGGTTSVAVNSGGTLLLGASSAIKSTAAMTLNGGTFEAGGFSQGSSNGTTATSGLGALTLSANSTLDFNTGTGATIGEHNVIAFSSVGTFTTGVTLTIDDWDGSYGSADGSAAGSSDDALYIGGALSMAQLADIQFYNAANGKDYAAAQAGNGEVYGTLTVVPEPSTIFAALALFGFVGYRERRRLASLLSLLS